MILPVCFLAVFVAVGDVFASFAAFEGGRVGVAVSAGWRRHRGGFGLVVVEVEKDLFEKDFKTIRSCLLLLSSFLECKSRG